MPTLFDFDNYVQEMDDGKKKIIDEVAGKERSRLITVVVSIFIVFIAYLLAFTPVSSKEVFGTTEYMSSVINADGHRPIAFIALDSGRKVQAEFPVGIVFMKGKKVHLIESKTLIGVSQFKVVKYAE